MVYVPATPVEALGKRVEEILKELYDLKSDMLGVLADRFAVPGLFACSLDMLCFNILVDQLTRKASESILILTRELKFIDESQFVPTLENNHRLSDESVKLLLTSSADVEDWGSIVAHLRELEKTPKVRVKINPSRTELRYMVVDGKQVLLVESSHKNAALIDSHEVAQYFKVNFEHYFEKGEGVKRILETANVKEFPNPEAESVRIKEELIKKGIITSHLL